MTEVNIAMVRALAFRFMTEELEGRGGGYLGSRGL